MWSAEAGGGAALAIKTWFGSKQTKQQEYIRRTTSSHHSTLDDPGREEAVLAVRDEGQALPELLAPRAPVEALELRHAREQRRDGKCRQVGAGEDKGGEEGCERFCGRWPG